MFIEPEKPQAVAFVDGQNLYHGAREAFGYTYPNYDVTALARRVCEEREWELKQVRFYTGVPAAQDNAFWNRFWQAKLPVIGREGTWIYSRPLRYRNKTLQSREGRWHTFLVGEEKGIDVRIALDVIRLAHHQDYDVALLFSQDQDLSEVADELRGIAREQERWIKMVSAYPVSPTSRNRRGINGTDWVKIERGLYDQCLDHRDYRRKGKLAA